VRARRRQGQHPLGLAAAAQRTRPKRPTETGRSWRGARSLGAARRCAAPKWPAHCWGLIHHLSLAARRSAARRQLPALERQQLAPRVSASRHSGGQPASQQAG